MTERGGVARPILVLDFDGTVCLGDAPVLGYAEQVARRLPAQQATRVRTGIEQFLAGALTIPDCEDGYQAVVALGGQDLSQAELSAAYLASRSELDAVATGPPEGLAQLLDDLRAQGTAVVLVTNAPLTGVDVWLEHHQIAGRLDAVVPDAGKPQQMAAVLTGILRQYQAGPAHLASVGDVWRNDIEPAMILGATGLFIDRFGTGRGPATHTERTVDALYPHIRQWVEQVRRTASGHHQVHPDTESSPN